MSAFLILRCSCRHQTFHRFAKANEQVGVLVAARAVHEVTALEPGSVPAHTWITRFPDPMAARNAFENLALRDTLSEAGDEPLVLLANAVPEAGYPEEMSFVPTHMNVDAGDEQPPHLLLIEGSASDQERMDQYRDVILPLMREERAYYLCFELGGDVEVLSGAWDEAILAISRWPGAHRALGFWLCDRYQSSAIPMRLGIGSFQVTLFEAERERS